eukprot:PLAT3514.3.p2 GENE.PLAT3514.3~~PLAT3514.3.p2  ORF type:complete len:154 (-),score=59.24 PLAT3514.3:21-425(-)
MVEKGSVPAVGRAKASMDAIRASMDDVAASRGQQSNVGERRGSRLIAMMDELSLFDSYCLDDEDLQPLLGVEPASWDGEAALAEGEDGFLDCGQESSLLDNKPAAAVLRFKISGAHVGSGDRRRAGRRCRGGGG